MTALQVAAAPRPSRVRAEPVRGRHGVPVASPVPWGPSDLTRLFVCNLLGAFGIVAAWLGASGTDRLSAQFNYASLGVLAFLLAGFGNGSWLLAGRRAVGARLAELLDGDPRTRLSVPQAEPTAPLEAARPVAVTFASNALVTVPGTVRYHLDHCALVRGKRFEEEGLEGHQAASRRACELCLPAGEMARA